MLTVDGRFEYTDARFPLGSDCACRLRAWSLKAGGDVVMATELDPSPGASVTNTAETWAAEACEEYGLDPGTTVFVEHYEPTDRRGETFDFVTFFWRDGRASSPEWKPATLEEIEKLVGEKLQ
jgi:hypothetical protein